MTKVCWCPARRGARRSIRSPLRGWTSSSTNKDEAQRHEARWFAQLATVAGEDGEAWKAITAARDLVEDLMSEVWATANVPGKRQEIRAALEETVKKMREIADR